MKISNIANGYNKFQFKNIKNKPQEKLQTTQLNKINFSFCSNAQKNGWFIIDDYGNKNQQAKLHIFFQENKPKICLKVEDNLITEIQDKEGNNIVPISQLDNIVTYAQKENLNQSFSTNYKLQQAQRRLKRYPINFYNDLVQDIKNKDFESFFKKLDINYDKKTKTFFGNLDLDKDIYGLDSISLAEVIQDCDISLEDIFLETEKIKGKFSSHFTDFRSLGKIKEINGDCEICNNKKLVSLGNIEKIDGNLVLGNCTKLRTIGNLKEVNKNINLYGTKIEPKEIKKLNQCGGFIISNNGETL